jgi:hypothetical protein
MVHHPLKAAAPITEAKWHPVKLHVAKGDDDGCLLSVLWPHWYLSVALLKVDFEEDFAVTKLFGEF